jgi:hypothetical protein
MNNGRSASLVLRWSLVPLFAASPAQSKAQTLTGLSAAIGAIFVSICSFYRHLNRLIFIKIFNK